MSKGRQYITNEKIRSKEVRLIGSDGEQIGVVSIEKAKELANNEDLDLLLLSPDTNPPVCKILNLGQHKYEQQKKEKLAKKNTKGQVTKELKLSPRISDHDYMVRLNAGQKFLKKGYNIKLTVFFRGRLMTRPELGKAVIERYIEEIADLGTSTGDIINGHRSLFTMISPK